MNWENKKAKQLNDDIYNGCFFDANYLIHVPVIFNRTFRRANFYFMACNAIRDGRDSINCDDVVVSYLTNYKIILTDIRNYVWKYYDQDKWLD
jgi:hypothetical protein